MDQLANILNSQINANSNTNTKTNTSLTNNSSQLLSKQMMANNNFNDFINKATTMITCGPGSECQKQQVTTNLEQKYLNAQVNSDIAPLQLETTKKNYYIYKEGRPYYNKMIEKELTAKAESIAHVISGKFNDEIENANIMNSYYSTIQNNSNNTIELYNEYLKKNKDLNAIIKGSHGDVLTNDRKTYYETEATDRLNMWHTVLLSLYYILVFTICVSLVLSPNNFSLPKKIIIIILVIIYPFVIHRIVVPIYNYFNTTILKNTETNVYLNL
jgi:hypothetical protein